MSLLVRVSVYHFGISPVMGGVAPLLGVGVEIRSGNRTTDANATSLDGVARFREFGGNYVSRINYLWSEAECSVVVDSN